MRSIQTWTVAAAGLLVSMGLAACGDAAKTDGPSEYDQRDQKVRVVPEFEVEGTHDFPENVRFDDLGMSVASIKLTPTGEKGGVAYSTSKPEGVRFDVASGNLERKGEAVVLPESGKFDVTLRLEPVDGEADAKESVAYSLALSGYVAGSTQPAVDPDNTDGPPLPAPASPEEWAETDSDDESSEESASDKTASPRHWMQFEYSTEKSVALTLDEVRLEAGTQILNFRLDLEEWASEIARPVERAVRSKTLSDATDRGGAVDVTHAVDSRGEGSRSLGEHVSVRTVASGSPGGL